MKAVLSTAVLWLGLAAHAAATPEAPTLPRLAVSGNGHYFVAGSEKPFFWLGDTAWELIHGATLDEARYYLKTRAEQGFTVIQTVVLAEQDGLRKPTPEGDTPFANADPARPQAAYFDKVDAIVAEAERRGLYVALVPAWGDKLTAPWGDGPRIFRLDNLAAAKAYGAFLAARLTRHGNVIWMLGGDRPARLRGLNNAYLRDMAVRAGFAPDTDWTPIWAAMADGIRAQAGSAALIAFHPQGGAASTSVALAAAPWLDVNAVQSGHGGGHDVPVWSWIARDVAVRPAKPTLDLEPNYEDHPYNPWPRWDPATGYFTDYDVRKQAYRSVFAGGAGVTYGHHAVWGFVGPRNDVVNHAALDWVGALQRPGGRQMRHLKELMLSRPYLDRAADPALVSRGQGTEGRSRMEAMRDAAGSYAFVYFPENDHAAAVDLGRLKAGLVAAWWFDPRTGAAAPIGVCPGGAVTEFRSPPNGPDWVLVLDDADRHYDVPGL